jgi:hypothetical protein
MDDDMIYRVYAPPTEGVADDPLLGIFQKGERILFDPRVAFFDVLEKDSMFAPWWRTFTERLDTFLEGTGHTLLEQAGQTDDRTLSRDVWRAFLIAMLLFLIGELLLCLPSRQSESPLASPAA